MACRRSKSAKGFDDGTDRRVGKVKGRGSAPRQCRRRAQAREEATMSDLLDLLLRLLGLETEEPDPGPQTSPVIIDAG